MLADQLSNAGKAFEVAMENGLQDPELAGIIVVRKSELVQLVGRRLVRTSLCFGRGPEAQILLGTAPPTKRG